jgi:hypothetical protein
MTWYTTVAVLAGVLLAPACSPSPVLSTVTGTVRDSTGRPIRYAQVAVRGTEYVTITDSAGAYRLRVPAQDSITLRAACICYRPREMTLHRDAEEVDFVLSRTPPRPPVPDAPDELTCDPTDSGAVRP